MALTARTARPGDTLSVLWPETQDYPMNDEQVFVVVDEQDRLLAGTVMFHGGHSLAYLGSTVIVAPARRAWVAATLLRYVTQWCRDHAIRRLGHGAGTVECMEAFGKLGAIATRQHVLMELQLE